MRARCAHAEIIDIRETVQFALGDMSEIDPIHPGLSGPLPSLST